MKKNLFSKNRIIAILFVIFFTVFSVISVRAIISPNRISPLHLFLDGSIVKGAWSTLTTNEKGAVFNLHTSGLEHGHAITIWWVIFNEPDKCTHPEGLFRCGPGDLPVFGGDDSAKTSLVYADGHVIGSRGIGNFGGTLKKGATTGALWGPGLINPKGADIHLVVHDHGRIIQGLTREMTHSFGAGCNNVPEGTGTPGPNNCTDVQFSVHEQQ